MVWRGRAVPTAFPEGAHAGEEGPKQIGARHDRGYFKQLTDVQGGAAIPGAITCRTATARPSGGALRRSEMPPWHVRDGGNGSNRRATACAAGPHSSRRAWRYALGVTINRAAESGVPYRTAAQGGPNRTPGSDQTGWRHKQYAQRRAVNVAPVILVRAGELGAVSDQQPQQRRHRHRWPVISDKLVRSQHPAPRAGAAGDFDGLGLGGDVTGEDRPGHRLQDRATRSICVQCAVFVEPDSLAMCI